jgi:hypothetical protein
MRIRKNIFVDPRICGTRRAVGPDGREIKEAAGTQYPPRNFEESPVIFVSDVLKHAERRDAVEGSGDIAVVLETDLDGQALAQLLCPLHLLT